MAEEMVSQLNLPAERWSPELLEIPLVLPGVIALLDINVIFFFTGD